VQAKTAPNVREGNELIVVNYKNRFPSQVPFRNYNHGSSGFYHMHLGRTLSGRLRIYASGPDLDDHYDKALETHAIGAAIR
jgi:hypothetical protein